VTIKWTENAEKRIWDVRDDGKFSERTGRCEKAYSDARVFVDLQANAERNP
jgi:hypothetical protein